MKHRFFSFFAGTYFLATLVLNGVVASHAYADSESLDVQSLGLGNFYEIWFCKRELGGDLFARTKLFFGLSRSDGSSITEDEFQSFVDAEVTPRFPDGLTVLSGNGQWRGESGAIIKEGSKVLILLYPFTKESSNKANEIRTAYINAFQQESVLRVDDQTCVSF